MDVAVVMLTHNRAPLLRQCLERVVARTSERTVEIVVWDNGSTDETPELLASFGDPRLRTIRSERNVGLSAYADAFALTSAPYLVQLDDDVVDAPSRWDETLLEASVRLPHVAFLAADVEVNRDDRVSFRRHQLDTYVEEVVNGVRLLRGPTGGWCTITPRSAYDAVGGMPRRPRFSYYDADGDFVSRLERHGYEYALLAGLRVRHAGDPPHRPGHPGKVRYFNYERRRRAWRNGAKRALLSVPGVRDANQRRGWFHEPT